MLLQELRTDSVQIHDDEKYPTRYISLEIKATFER